MIEKKKNLLSLLEGEVDKIEELFATTWYDSDYVSNELSPMVVEYVNLFGWSDFTINAPSAVVDYYYALEPREFYKASGFQDIEFDLPTRGTAASAGYDIAAVEDTLIPAGTVVLVPTGVKALMLSGEVLMLYLRSSLAYKKDLVMYNSTGVIDADYFENVKNDGHIMVMLHNVGHEDVLIEKGERIAQGVFMTFETTVSDRAYGSRIGGIGSTGN